MHRLKSALCALLLLAQPLAAQCVGENLIAALPAAEQDALRAAAESVPHANGNYWRGVTFDTYNGRQWINNDQDATAIGTGKPINAPAYFARRVITQTVTTYLRGESVLFAAPQPIGAEVAGSADVTYLPNEQIAAPQPNGEGQAANETRPVDISRMRSRQQFKEGASYQVISAISTADEKSLRQAGTAYPTLIRQRYLQLPDDLPPRIKALAADITANAANPYDKVVILEQFLRAEIKYNEKIAAPPADVDPIDYVLFLSLIHI